MLLYKYCTYSTNSLSILINKKVWYSKPADFNDPFDGDFLATKTCTFEEFIRIFPIDAHPDTYKYNLLKSEFCDKDGFLKPEQYSKHASIKDVYKNVGVLCLTPRRDSTLMWSHYSDKHTGFSIQFNVPDDIPICKINYAGKLTENHLSYYYNPERLGKNGYIDIEFTKHLDWEYEDEYRLSVSGGNRLLDIPGSITEINFGCRMSDSQKETIANLVLKLPKSEDIAIFTCQKVDDLCLKFQPYK